jgi:putative intracellular protease/amidase
MRGPLADMKSEDFDTIFFVGGHGPMWDIVDNPDAIRLIESFYNSGKPVAAVCHSSPVFHRVTYNGEPLIKGKRVTGKKVGGLYEKAADWEPFAIVDGRVLTGRNPASSTVAAKALIELLAARKAA